MNKKRMLCDEISKKLEKIEQIWYNIATLSEGEK